MTIGLFGPRGSGKSQMQTILGMLLSQLSNFPLYSNCQIRGSKKITLKDLLYNIQNAVICLDEFWQKMDSRSYKDRENIFITHWYQMQRHKNLMIIYTTQLLSQIEKRIRDSTDYFIMCQVKKKEQKQFFKYTIIDGFTMKPIRTIKTDESKVKFIWDYYDHVGYVDSLE